MPETDHKSAANIYGKAGTAAAAVETVQGISGGTPLPVTSGVTATDLGKAEDAVHADGDTGVMMLGVANVTNGTNLSSAEGDYTPLSVDRTGRVGIGIVFPGTNATALGKAEDAAHTTGNVGVFVLSKRTDTPASSADTTEDYASLNTDSLGNLWVRQAAPTATVTSVADAASSATLLALNTSRKGATFFNDSTSILYLKLGATASTTSFTVKMQPDDYYEVPAGYTGIIDGIWSSDASGSARITELT